MVCVQFFSSQRMENREAAPWLQDLGEFFAEQGRIREMRKSIVKNDEVVKLNLLTFQEIGAFEACPWARGIFFLRDRDHLRRNIHSGDFLFGIRMDQARHGSRAAGQIQNKIAFPQSDPIEKRANVLFLFCLLLIPRRRQRIKEIADRIQEKNSFPLIF